MLSPQQKAEQLLDSIPSEDILFYLFDRAVNSEFSLGQLVKTRPFFDSLLVDYRKPLLAEPNKNSINRDYHDFFHIAEGVKDLIGVEGCCSSINDVLLAWFSHDRIYLLDKEVDNERSSAAACFADLTAMGWSAARAGRIFDLIMFTKHDKNPPEEDYEANLIVDIDLQRMAVKDFDTYMFNVSVIRSEYLRYTEKEWITGRTKFLENFLEKKKGKIFGTRQFQNLNPIAIRNISSELTKLRQSIC